MSDSTESKIAMLSEKLVFMELSWQEQVLHIPVVLVRKLLCARMFENHQQGKTLNGV
jgi:hypothetical protein